MARTGVGAMSLALLAFGLLGVACGSSDSSESGAGEGADNAGAARAPRAEDPQSDVALQIRDLLWAYDAAVNEIVARPELAADPESPAVQDLKAVFTEDNELAGNMLAGWSSQAVSGLTIRAYGDDHGAYTSVLVEPVSVDEDEEEVTFTFCSEERYRVHQGGVAVDVVPYEVFEGEGVVVLQGGEWLLDDMSLTGDSGSCETEEGE